MLNAQAIAISKSLGSTIDENVNYKPLSRVSYGNSQEPLYMKGESADRNLLSFEGSGPLPFPDQSGLRIVTSGESPDPPSRETVLCRVLPPSGGQAGSPVACHSTRSPPGSLLLAIPLTCLLRSRCGDQKLCFY